MPDASPPSRDAAPPAPPSLAGGVGGTAAAKLVTAGLSFALTLVLARVLPTEAFGHVALVLAWLAVGTAVAGLSMPWVIVRHVPEYLAEGAHAHARGVVRFAQSRSLAAAVVVALAVVVADRAGLAAVPPALATPLAIGAAMLVPSVLLGNGVALLQARKRVLAAEVISNVVRVALTIAALLAAAAWWPGPMSAARALEVCLGALLASAVLCAAYQRATRPAGWAAVAVAEPARWWKTARAFFAVFVVAAVGERVDILVLGLTGTPSDVAVYAVATRFAQVLAMVTGATSAVLAPHFVERLADLRRGDAGALRGLVRGAARTCALLVAACALAFVVAGPWLLALFGDAYRASYAPLAILAAGHVAASLFGPANAVAALAERPGIPIGSIAAGALASAALNVALVPGLGASGAAAGCAAGLVVTAALSRWLAQKAIGLETSPLAPPAPSSPSPSPP